MRLAVIETRIWAGHVPDTCFKCSASCMQYKPLEPSKAARSEVRSDLQTAAASLDTIVPACRAFRQPCCSGPDKPIIQSRS